MHHELGDLDGQRASLISGEAVSAQHHPVGPGGAVRKGVTQRGSALGCPVPLLAPHGQGHLSVPAPEA